MRNMDSLMEKIIQFGEFWAIRTSDEAKEMSDRYIKNLIEETSSPEKKLYYAEWERQKLLASTSKIRKTTTDYYVEKSKKEYLK